MAKKRRKSNEGLLDLGSLVLAVVGLIMWFVIEPIKNLEHTYMDYAFGKTSTVLGVSVKVLDFNFLNFIGFILIILGALFLVLLILKSKSISKKLLTFLSFILLIAAAVMLFMVHKFVLNDSIIQLKFELDALGYIAPIVLILSALLQAYKMIKK